MQKVTTPPTPTEALREWAKRNGLNPARLSRTSKLSYSYAWMLLNGDKPVTSDTLGRLIMAFGSESLKSVEEALKSESSRC